jgi:hypothetical protein
MSVMARIKEVDLAKDKPEMSLKLGEWIKQRAAYKDLEAKEFALRQELVLNAGFDQTKLEGSQTIGIGFGCRLKAGKTMYYSLTNAQGETSNLLAKIAEKRHDLAVGLVQWKPDMSQKTYKELLEWLESLDGIEGAEYANEVAALLAAAVTVKPGAPQLEFIEPTTEPEIENKV